MTLGGWMGPHLGSRLRGSCRNQGDPLVSNGDCWRSKGGGVSLHHAGFSAAIGVTAAAFFLRPRPRTYRRTEQPVFMRVFPRSTAGWVVPVSCSSPGMLLHHTPGTPRSTFTPCQLLPPSLNFG